MLLKNLINGNNQRYTTDKDLTICLTSQINDVALKNWENQSGLKFKNGGWGTWLIARPTNAMQVIKLLVEASTFGFKVTYSDNHNNQNTLFLEVVQRKV